MKMTYAKNKSPTSDRKIRKPLMERKRRQRINDCLDDLQCILMDSNIRFKDSSITKSGQKTAKLEKADILEMTVKYLRSLHDENKKCSQITNQSSIVETSCDKKVQIMLHPKSDIIFLMPMNNNSVEHQSHNGQSKFSENDTKKVWRPW